MSDPATALSEASVTYTAVLPVQRSTVQAVAARLHQHRCDVGTRRGRRALGVFDRAVMFCRWLVDATGVAQLAVDNAISLKSAYRCLDEVLDVAAAGAPSLRGALLAARAAGYAHVALDGTLISIDRCSIPGPTIRRTKAQASGTNCPEGDMRPRKVDLWWSGKHHCHGGNIQVITAPDGWPLGAPPACGGGVCAVRPGREHDTTCARTHPGLLAALEDFSDEHHAVLADLGYEGEADRLTCPTKTPADGSGLDQDTRAANRAHNATRARAERGNALLKHSKACAESPSAPPASAPSPPQPWSSSTSNTTAPHDTPSPIKPLLTKAH